MFGLPPVAAVAFGARARAYRFTRVEREFAAGWSRLPAAAKRRALASAYAAGRVAADAPAETLDELMFAAVAERRRVMRRLGQWDFEQLRRDLRDLLDPARRRGDQA